LAVLEHAKVLIYIRPRQIVYQWREELQKYTDLTAMLHYDRDHYRQSDHDRVMKGSKPWKVVVITTSNTFNTRITQNALAKDFWVAGRFHRIVIDEAHKLKTSGLSPGQYIRPEDPSGSRINVQVMGGSNAMANNIINLNAPARWMLTATPLTTSLTDLRWPIRFLERKTWLELNLPPHTFDLKSRVKSMGTEWEPPSDSEGNEEEQLSGSDSNSTWTILADPFNRGPACNSLVHCTTRAWDYYIAPNINRFMQIMAQESRAVQKEHDGQPSKQPTEEEKKRGQRSQEKAGRYAFAILRMLILRRSATSRIPFQRGPHILQLPPMITKTVSVKFSQRDRSLEIYKQLIEDFTTLRTDLRDSEGKDATNNLRYKPEWRFIRLISLSPLLALPSMDETWKTSELYEKTSQQSCEVDYERLNSIVQQFITHYAGYGTEYLPKPDDRGNYIIAGRRKAAARALQWGAPKLGHLRVMLRELHDTKDKAVLWCAWPLTQWLVVQVRS
jgi:hypothetical protein